MKILTITTDFPYKSEDGTITQGGGGSCVAQLVRGLDRKGIKVSVVTREEKNLKKELLDIPIHRTKFIYLGFRESKITHSIFALPSAMNIVKKENPDIIHSHNPAAALVGIACAKVFNKPHVLTMHGPWSSVRLQNLTRIIARKIESFVLKNSTVTTCDSNALVEEMKRLHGVKTIGIQNAVDSELFTPMTKKIARKKININFDGQLILFTGRFVVEKGLDTLLDAAAIVLSKEKNVKFLLIGGGFNESIVSNWLEKNPEYSKNILVIPFLKHEMMNPAYRAADVFVLPSVAEGLSRSLMEAMICSVPCVATEVGGNVELLSNDRGILVPVRNSEKLAVAITKVIDDNEFAKRLVRNAKMFAMENLTVERRINSFIKIYKLILNKVN
ncbi:MAG: glycosyltransferase family 4 protein [Candidatus Micrarchaeota archaeon]|nr:glycosyltransferase family 4 protein [Candidatus Micrarchaeota archaeon]